MAFPREAPTRPNESLLSSIRGTAVERSPKKGGGAFARRLPFLDVWDRRAWRLCPRTFTTGALGWEGHTGNIRRIALLGNHAPRQCGIATFTTDLGAALSREFSDLDCFVIAMNDAGKHYPYPPRVRFEIAENDSASYQRAADFLNVNTVDVTCVQHEYGIFGGKAGSHVLPLLRDLRMPIVTTLHTILSEPTPLQRAVLGELGQLS